MGGTGRVNAYLPRPAVEEMEPPIRTSLATRGEIRSFTTDRVGMNSVGLLAPHSLIPSYGGTMLPCSRPLQPARTFELDGGHCRAAGLSAAHHSHLGQIVAERFAADPSTVVSLTTDVSGSGVRPHL